MKLFQKWVTKAFAGILVLLLVAQSGLAAAGDAMHGATIAESTSDVYALIATDNGDTALVKLPYAGGQFEVLENGADLEDLLFQGGTLYYLTMESGAMQLMKRTAEGGRQAMLRFTDGAVAENLLMYENTLYLLVDNKLYSVNPETAAMALVSDAQVQEFAIADDRIYYASLSETKEYEKTSLTSNESLTATAGVLRSMGLDGDSDTLVFDEGVSMLTGRGSRVYFHNYADSYQMGDSEEWLEGSLYRLNTEDDAVESVAVDYDWNYFPVDGGVVVYQMNRLALYPDDGSDPVDLYKPEGYVTIEALGDNLYVLDGDGGQLVRLRISDPTQTEVLLTNLPSPEDLPGEGDEGDEGEDADEDGDEDEDADEDETESDSSKEDDYILPSSSTHKISESTLRKLSLSTLGYARNEILARHGYEFKTSKYRKYFTGKSWYKPGGYSYSKLNSIERYNVEAIKAMEAEKSGKSQGTDSSYVFKDSNTRKLKKSEIRALSKEKMGYARNEILARHGYRFETKKYKDYFAKKSWYTPGGYKASKLNSTEWYNIDLIKEVEAESEGGGKTDSSYIFKDSDTRKLKKSEIRALSKEKMGYARNEILARHGYKFETKKYKDYFAKKSWYTPGGYKESKLSSTEWYNIDLIKEIESE